MQRVIDLSRQWIVAAALMGIMGLLALIMFEVFRADTTVTELPPELSLPTLEPDAEITANERVTEPTVNPEELYVSGEEQVVSAESADAQQPNNGPLTHEVRAGDTLFEIALQYGTTVDAIVALNRLANPNDLDIGQQLQIPTPEPTNN